MSEKATILTYNIPTLEEKIAKINKRAEKLKVEPLRIETSNPRPEKVGDEHYEVVDVEIKGCEPKIAGWIFIGTLDYFSLPGQVIVKTVPGKEIPEELFESVRKEARIKEMYRYELPLHKKDSRRKQKIEKALCANPICDHCHTRRRRTETFVVQNETTGEFKRVGRNCLKDFLGHSPAAILRYLSNIWALVYDLENPDSDYHRYGGGGGYRSPQLFELNAVLNMTAAAIRHWGWVSRKAASLCEDGSKEATSTYIWNFFHSKPGTFEPLDIIDDDREEVRKAVEWVKEQNSKDSEYIYNLQTIVNSDYVSNSIFGIACSLIAAYYRANKIEAEKKLMKNEWIGDIKDKVETIVKVRSLTPLANNFNGDLVKLFRMVDTEGRTLVWFSNSFKGIQMEEGKTYAIKGTVKKHDEYKDWKQTILTRVKVLKEVEAEETEAEAA